MKHVKARKLTAILKQLMALSLPFSMGAAHAAGTDVVPAGYTLCAQQYHACVFKGVADVIYGDASTWSAPTRFANGSGCDNGTFGNPDPGKAKVCYYKPAEWDVQVEDGTTFYADSLYVVVNTNDPSSVQLASDYMAARNIPAGNMLSVALPVQEEITASQAAPLAAAITSAANAKGFVMAWSMPYRVGPNESITSFVSMGYIDTATLPMNGGCFASTPQSTYYASGPLPGRPSGNTITFKPSMLLASYSSYNPALAQGTAGRVMDPTTIGSNAASMSQYLAGARATFNSGMAADYHWYSGTAYFLKTSDANRSVRNMQLDANAIAPYINTQFLQQDALTGKADVLMYETGLANLDPSGGHTNTFLPGAVGDTLTSFSGRLYDSYGQVSALEFLRAGATASYGTVREPCAYPAKFPDPAFLAIHLYAGDSVMEAYWKSVATPMEGLFIGEPLARPYSRMRATYMNGDLKLSNQNGINGYYDIYIQDNLIASNVLLKQKAAAPTDLGSISYSGAALLRAVLKTPAN